VIFGDASLTPSTLSQRIADPKVPVEDRLRALREVTTHHPVDLYNTPAHLALSQFLLHHLKTLNRGTFPVNGTHARTIIGPQGMGKSTVLRQLVRAADVAFPKVISVYVSYEVPRREELIVTVARHLVDRGVMGPSTFADASRADSLDDTVMDTLHSQGRRLLLVVDEIDHLYRVDHAKNPQEAYAAFRSLGSLALLGSVAGGVSKVLLCGSSTALPLQDPPVFGRPQGWGRDFLERTLPPRHVSHVVSRHWLVWNGY
jgi:Cdc6-like AAA superfamily ATPase